jgi:hypothetical protein
VKTVLAAVTLALGIVTSPAAAGGVKAHHADKDWSGWWLIYRHGRDGRLEPDKVTTAIVINDRLAPGSKSKFTGQWMGCVWLPATKFALKNKTATLTFAPPGSRNTFRMRRTGVDEAEGIYLDDPRRLYVAKLTRDHGECAAYGP